MGFSSYSSVSRGTYEEDIKHKQSEEIFSKRMDDAMSPMDIGIRESRDSEAHLKSLAIIIALDVTGSMGRIPEKIVKKDLTTLMTDIIQAGTKDVQIMFLAIGDHTCDNHPLQIGQFESGDQELAKWLESTYLEGGGGGQWYESYMLAWLIGGKHTSIDCLEKRGQKGFIFTIGDEANHNKLTGDDLKKITGEASQGFTDKELLKLAKEKYNVYHIHTNDTGYKDNKTIMGYWKDILGQNFIVVDDYHQIVKTIASTVNSELGLPAEIEPVKEKEDIL